jgi:hypothetical protein
MEAKNVTLEHVMEVHQIYRSVGGNRYRRDAPQKLYDKICSARDGDVASLQSLREGARYGSRYGSSKLVFDIRPDGTIHVRLNTNLDTSTPWGETMESEALGAESRFLELVNGYFDEIES